MGKKVILLVGPMGSGKTTYCENNYSNYYRISQDEQGKKEHFELYNEAIENEEPLIIVDRINHLSKQRYKFLNLAKKFGYDTEIIVLNLEFKECYNRLLSRDKHPTLNNKVGNDIILKALRMYFKEYQRPTLDEADNVWFETNYDPYMLDLSNKYNKFVLIGDVHGCYDELIELYESEKIQNFIDDNTAIIFLGDLVDKGPKIREVIDFFNFTSNCYTVLGNHEEKLRRYLRGNNVSITHGLDKTIEQLEIQDITTSYAQKLLFQLESIPYIIKLSNTDYVVHAGVNPLKSIDKQSREYLLYARTFNQKTLEFSNNNDLFWFEYYDKKKENIYFGHNYNDKIQVKDNVYSLDGYCVYGNELRSLLLDSKKNTKEFHTLKAKNIYCKNEIESNNDSLSNYEQLVFEKYINKVETNDLVLYNYSDKCTYEAFWNEFTLKSRGIIYEKNTNKLIARPFTKFFNLNENEESQLHNLPIHLSYEVYEKSDGSLGILYWYNNQWNIATRGSFNSEQAIEGLKIMQNYNLSYLDTNYTYLVEIIYPENKIIVNYGNERKLVLLGAIKVDTADELSYDSLLVTSKKTGMDIVKRFNYSILELIKLQKEIPKDIEGFIIKFNNGLRIKIKGEEYLKLAKIIANISPISLWEVMNNGKVSIEYLQQIPEELYTITNQIVNKLESQYQVVSNKIYTEYNNLPNYIFDDNLKITKKNLGIYLDKNKKYYNYSAVFFAILLDKKEQLDDYILRIIRPKSNEFIRIK